MPDEVKEVKIFHFGQVGNRNANFAETTCQQRPPDVQVLTSGDCLIWRGCDRGGSLILVDDRELGDNWDVVIVFD